MVRGNLDIIVVDDDSSMRLAVQRFLLVSGFRSVTFASAEALLETDAASTASCLVLDIQLSGMSGLNLMQKLKRAGNAVPVIYITAHDDPHTRQQAEAQGAVAYLTKPFEGSVLIEAVRRALAGADRHLGIEGH